MNDIVPRETLSKQGMAGFTAVGGGIGLWAMSMFGWLGFVIGGVLTVAGVAVSMHKEDRKPGLVIAGAGVLGILSAAITGFPDLLLRLAGTGLIAFGGLSIWRFFRGIKSRM